MRWCVSLQAFGLQLDVGSPSVFVAVMAWSTPARESSD